MIIKSRHGPTKGFQFGGIVTGIALDLSQGILPTLAESCKNGIGEALVHVAKKRDHDQFMAILMPKGMAWGLFTTMGFKVVSKFPFYIYGVSAEEL